MSLVSLHPMSTTTTATTGSVSSTSSSSSDQTSLNALGQTFMSLLVKELQNQDPTSPVDTTQMVGQMISLNQLDQIASINQLLTNTLQTSGASSGSTSTASGQSVAGNHLR